MGDQDQKPSETVNLGQLDQEYNNFKFKQQLLTWTEIRQNFLLCSDFSHSICRSMSNTQLESNLKWDLYCNIDHSMRRWSLGATVTTLAFWVRYCLKGNSNTIKAITGILYTTNIANIYILGQYFGIFLNLKDGLNG